MKNEYVDLHSHSTASDGTLTPAELVRYAAKKRLRAFSLTDHDGVDGLDEAMAEGERLGVEVIPGVELSAEHANGTMHVLGFFVDRKQGGLQEKLRKLQKGREERNPQIIKKLQDLGVDITFDEVRAASGGGLIGRPHFAKVLLEKKVVPTMQQAFEKYLKKGAPAYVEKFRFTPEDTIRLIHEGGGVAVLAHPFTVYKSNQEVLDQEVGKLAKAGLDGIEVYYSTYSSDQSRKYRYLAEQNDLLFSGGSDFHGSHKPGIDLGVGYGQLRIPYEVVEKLRKRSTQYPTLQ
ncbi:MAG TPA: PHP domain-containing protein [Nitrospiria bacterium]|nr:PHP domain-containing protein [Nitrospiria bacterium]